LAPPVLFLLPLFKVYGPHLYKLSCHQFLLQDENGGSKKLFNLHLKHLRDLTISGIVNDEDGNFDETLKTLGQLKLPRLKRLAFVRDEEHGVVVDEDDACIFGDCDKELFKVLGRFSDSLEEVRLYKLYSKELAIPAGAKDVKIMSKVKSLTLCADNLNDPVIWKRIQTQFPNLEVIRLEPTSEMELLATSVNSDDDEEEEDEDEDEDEEMSSGSDEDDLKFLEKLDSTPTAILPDAEKRKDFFNNFSKLKNLIWIKNKSSWPGYAAGRLPKTLTFTRRDEEPKLKNGNSSSAANK